MFRGIIAATRPTRRDMFTWPGRLAAAVALIALPVAVVVGLLLNEASTSNRYVADDDRVTISKEGSQCTQGAHSWNADCTGPAQATAAEYTEALPEGFEAQPSAWSFGTFGFEGRYEFGQLQQHPIEILAPQLGVIPGAGEVVLSRYTARELGAQVGDTVEFRAEDFAPQGLDVQLEVVGLSPDSDSLAGPGSLLTPEQAASPDYSSRATWNVLGPRALEWADVEAANAHGFVIESPALRDIAPPEPKDNPSSVLSPMGSMWLWDVLLTVAAGAFWAMVFLLMMLFISPVFSLALSRHTRLFALLSTQGASRGHIAAAVLVFGLFAGLIGATLGVALGALGGWGWFSFRNPGWAPVVPWPTMAGAWAVAALGSTLAAAVPAWIAARGSLSRAIAGGAPDTMVRWRRWMLIGPVGLIVAGAAALAARALPGETPPLMSILSPVFGLVVVVFLALTAPALVWGAARLTEAGPMALRLAGRGLARRSMHSIPAVAAVVCLTALVVWVNVSDRAVNARSEQLDMQIVDARAVLLKGDDTAALDRTQTLAEDYLGKFDSADVAYAPSGQEGYYNPDLFEAGTVAFDLASPDQATCSDGVSYEDSYDSSQRFRDSEGRSPLTDSAAARVCLHTMASSLQAAGDISFQDGVLIGDEDALALWHFESDADRQRAAAALRAGGVVVARGSGFVGQDTARFEAAKYEGGPEWEDNDGDEPAAPVSTATAELPVAESLSPWTPHLTMVSPAAAEQLGITQAEPARILLFEQAPDRHALDELSEALSQAARAEEPGAYAMLSTPVDYQDRRMEERVAPALILGVATLIACALVVALAAAGLRREARTLASVGASPRLPAAVAAWQIWLISSVALWAGQAVAYAGVALSASRDRFTAAGDRFFMGTLAHMQWSWELAAVAVVVPAVLAGLAWLMHRRSGSPETLAGRATDRLLA